MSKSVGLSAKQMLFMRESSSRVCLLEGSIRSGKTIVSLLRWLMFVARAPRGGELVMIGRTRDAVFRNVLKPLQDDSLFGDLASVTVYTNGSPTAKIFGRTVHIIGASDAKAEKVIRGMTVAGAYVDEVTVIPEEFFTQLLGRMSVPGAQLFGTTNPDSPAHWLRTKFLDRIHELPDWKSWHFTIDDNPSLTESYKAGIRAEFTGLWFRRFILGEWVAAEGAVYSMWDPAVHVIPEANVPSGLTPLYVGLDFGAVHPSRGYLVQMSADRLYVTHEWAPAKGLTSAQQAESAKAWIASIPQPKWVAVDHAAQGFLADLRLAGVQRTMHAFKSVLPGIQTIGNLLAGQRLVVSDACAELIKEFPGYVWDEKASLAGQTKPVKNNDDALDALRYALYTSRSQWEKRIPIALPSSSSADED